MNVPTRANYPAVLGRRDARHAPGRAFVPGQPGPGSAPAGSLGPGAVGTVPVDAVAVDAVTVDRGGRRCARGGTGAGAAPGRRARPAVARGGRVRCCSSTDGSASSAGAGPGSGSSASGRRLRPWRAGSGERPVGTALVPRRLAEERHLARTLGRQIRRRGDLTRGVGAAGGRRGPWASRTATRRRVARRPGFDAASGLHRPAAGTPPSLRCRGDDRRRTARSPAGPAPASGTAAPARRWAGRGRAGPGRCVTAARCVRCAPPRCPRRAGWASRTRRTPGPVQAAAGRRAASPSRPTASRPPTPAERRRGPRQERPARPPRRRG